MTALEKLMEYMGKYPSEVCIDAGGMYIPKGVKLTAEQYRACLEEMEELMEIEEEENRSQETEN